MTNGFNLTKVLAALHGRIGWKQPPAAGAPVVTSPNQTARSGRHFQDFHSLVTLNNIRATMEETSPNEVNFNKHLEDLAKAAILRCVNGVFRTNDFVEKKVVYEPLQAQSIRTIANTDLFVGYEITIAKSADIAVQINTVQLKFDSDHTFNIYLFAEGKKEPLLTKSVSAVGGDTVLVALDDTAVLNFIHESYQGSRFYLGYFQSDLGDCRAIQQDGCFTQTNVFKARPMYADQSGELNFDRTKISYTGSAYGLNMEISAFRDHTDQIVKNPSVFDEAIGLTLTYTVIEQIINATKSNPTERILKDELTRAGIQLDLTGAAPISQSPRVTGLSQRIEAELKRLRSSFYSKPRGEIVDYGNC
jgi:hypothetical protein